MVIWFVHVILSLEAIESLVPISKLDTEHPMIALLYQPHVSLFIIYSGSLLCTIISLLLLANVSIQYEGATYCVIRRSLATGHCDSDACRGCRGNRGTLIHSCGSLTHCNTQARHKTKPKHTPLRKTKTCEKSTSTETPPCTTTIRPTTTSKTKSTTETTSSLCAKESERCADTGDQVPRCCADAGTCIQGFNYMYCRTSCLPDNSPCSLNDPGACCGQICLIDGYCITI